MRKLKNNIELYLVTDEKACKGRDFFWVVEEAVKGGVTIVQLREKSLGTRAFINRALRLKDLLQPYNIPLIINDRTDIALVTDADGVHVGQSDMHYNNLKDLLPEGKIIGISAEKQQDVFEAEPWDISYLAVSPLFATPSKTDTERPWELEGLRWVRNNSRHDLVVIGGLNYANSFEAMRNGANAVAVISAVCSAESPRDAARSILNSLSRISTDPLI